MGCGVSISMYVSGLQLVSQPHGNNNVGKSNSLPEPAPVKRRRSELHYLPQRVGGASVSHLVARLYFFLQNIEHCHISNFSTIRNIIS